MPRETPRKSTARKPPPQKFTDQDLRRRAERWLEKLLDRGEAASSADLPQGAGQHGDRDRSPHDAVT